MTTVVRSRSLFPLDWPGFGWLPLGGPTIRIEEFVEGRDYVVRAELPGVDPTKDIEVTVEDRMLRIQVERAEEHRERGHSEFHYGSFYRSVPLPSGAKGEDVKARYDKGILEVRIQVAEPETKAREIRITVGDGNGKKG